jgi:hypothetical protein
MFSYKLSRTIKSPIRFFANKNKQKYNQKRRLYSNGSPQPPSNDNIIPLIWLSCIYILYDKSREPPTTPI